jgi:hypothetical protein
VVLEGRRALGVEAKLAGAALKVPVQRGCLNRIRLAGPAAFAVAVAVAVAAGVGIAAASTLAAAAEAFAGACTPPAVAAAAAVASFAGGKAGGQLGTQSATYVEAGILRLKLLLLAPPGIDQWPTSGRLHGHLICLLRKEVVLLVCILTRSDVSQSEK